MTLDHSSQPHPPATRWALVTGASSGIGAEFARLLAARGYALALSARREDRLHSLAAELRDKHRVPTHIAVADLSQPAAASHLASHLAEARIEVDVLINNAGFGVWGPFAEVDWQREAAMLQLNIVALTELTKRLLPGMLARRQGHVLNVASTAAFQPGPFMAVYFATKAYVLSFSEAVNEELRGTGVSITTLCPGPTESEFFDAAAVQSKRLTGRKLPTSLEVAQYGLDAMFARKRTVVHGARNRFLAQLQRFVPRGPVIRMVRAMVEH
jgi:short-subunit dehydrogenase